MINEEEVVWDEPTPIEQPQAIDENQIVWDDASSQNVEALIQEQPSLIQQAPVQTQREFKPTISMAERVQKKIKEREKIQKAEQESNPIMKSILSDIGMTEDAQIIEKPSIIENTAKAHKLKALNENIEFEYGDLVKQFESSTGDEDSKKYLQEKQNKVNTEVVKALKLQGVESYYNKGRLLVVGKDEDGNEVLQDLDDEMLETIIAGFGASGGETAGAISMAGTGASAGFKAGGIDPRKKLIGAAVGGLAAGYAGSAIGKYADLLRATHALNKKLSPTQYAEKATAAGVADIVGVGAIGAVGKAASKAVAPLGKIADKAKTLLTQGNLQGAKKQIMLDFDVTDADIDKLYKNVAKDVEYADDLSGDDLLRAKLTAVMQQQPQGLEPLREAVKKSTKAAIETSKEIDKRAKEVMHSSSQFAKNPSAIKKSVEKYEKAVQDNYGEVRNLIDEALPNHKSDLDITTFKETLNDLNKRVIDPTVKEKITNLAESLASQKSETVGDLINVRQLFNKFYGKNLQHFDTKPDKAALKSIQDAIDGKIDEALDTLPDNVGTSLKTAFTDAKKKYVDMFKTQDTATYNAIFKKGASESDIANSLIKYSKSTDKDLETVLSKLSPVQRTKAEFAVISKMVKDSLKKGEAKAINFAQLAENIGTSEKLFKTPEAKQFIKNVKGFNTKFAKDVELQSTALGVTEKTKKNIATSVEGKAKMVIASNYFEAFQRLFPSETGRRLSLQKAIEMSLEKSRSPREFFFNASKIKGLPTKDREALKRAVKEIGAEADKINKQIKKEK
jgi:hypothetical protein